MKVIFNYDAKLAPNIMNHCRKLVQIMCYKSAGTKMHKCLVGTFPLLNYFIYKIKIIKICKGTAETFHVVIYIESLKIHSSALLKQ